MEEERCSGCFAQQPESLTVIVKEELAFKKNKKLEKHSGKYTCQEIKLSYSLRE